MAKQWIAFFSQTGSEIIELSKAIGVSPVLCVSNNIDEKTFKLHREMYRNTITRGSHNTLMNYFMNIAAYDPLNTIITLHGYLRILPPEMCEKYTIYNGHPGAIDIYPELKGKDPQARTWENKGKYDLVGSVVHKVVPAVDEGGIITSVHAPNVAQSLDELYNTLKKTSLEAWIIAMKELKLCA